MKRGYSIFWILCLFNKTIFKNLPEGSFLQDYLTLLWASNSGSLVPLPLISNPCDLHCYWLTSAPSLRNWSTPDNDLVKVRNGNKLVRFQHLTETQMHIGEKGVLNRNPPEKIFKIFYNKIPT